MTKEFVDHSEVTKKSVNFSFVQVREYERIIGCHPCCVSGMPLSLGWAHSPSIKHTVDDHRPKYEPLRDGENILQKIHTIKQSPNGYVNNVKRLTFIERKNKLKKVSGLSEDEITLLERKRIEEIESDAKIYKEVCRIKRDAVRLEAQTKRRLRNERKMQETYSRALVEE